METRFNQLLSCNKMTFKSYYVVWKLDIFVVVAEIFIEFKSYYVVWKLFLLQSLLTTLLRLNRTM